MNASGLNIKCIPRVDSPDIMYDTLCKINSAVWHLRRPDIDQYVLFAMTEEAGQRLLAELMAELRVLELYNIQNPGMRKHRLFVTSSG